MSAAAVAARSVCRQTAETPGTPGAGPLALSQPCNTSQQELLFLAAFPEPTP